MTANLCGVMLPFRTFSFKAGLHLSRKFITLLFTLFLYFIPLSLNSMKIAEYFIKDCTLPPYNSLATTLNKQHEIKVAHSEHCHRGELIFGHPNSKSTITTSLGMNYSLQMLNVRKKVDESGSCMERIPSSICAARSTISASVKRKANILLKVLVKSKENC